MPFGSVATTGNFDVNLSGAEWQLFGAGESTLGWEFASSTYIDALFNSLRGGSTNTSSLNRIEFAPGAVWFIESFSTKSVETAPEATTLFF